MVQFGGVPRKGRIRASIKKLFGQVQKKCSISVSTGKWSNPREYREKVESERVSKNCTDECRKMVESVLVPENGRIYASNEKLCRRVLKNGRISVST